MNTPDQLLSKISDELGRRLMTVAGSTRSATPSLKVLPGFPFTLVRTEESPAEEEEVATEDDAPVIYEVGSDNAGDYIKFFLANPTVTNGDYPVRMSLDTNNKQFFFLKLVVDVDSACYCDDEELQIWGCLTRDATTTSVTVEKHTTIPEQTNPSLDGYCGSTTEGNPIWGWIGYLTAGPSGTFTVYLPLLCFDPEASPQISYAGDSLDEITVKNTMYSQLRDSMYLAGDSERLWWSNGAPTTGVEGRLAGDPGAVSAAGIWCDAIHPDDSEYVLSSL